MLTQAEKFGDVSAQRFHHPYEAVDGDEIFAARKVISGRAAPPSRPLHVPLRETS